MQPELIEFHDGKVKGIILKPGGSGTIQFSHLAVYERKAHELYEVVSYEADLVLTGVRHFRCDDFTDSDMISTLSHDHGEMSSLVATQMTHTPVKGSFSILFVTGGRIEFECDSMLLRIGSRNRVLEIWKGPL